MTIFETILSYVMGIIVTLFFIAFVVDIFKTIGDKLEEVDKFGNNQKK